MQITSHAEGLKGHMKGMKPIPVYDNSMREKSHQS